MYANKNVTVYLYLVYNNPNTFYEPSETRSNNCTITVVTNIHIDAILIPYFKLQ